MTDQRSRENRIDDLINVIEKSSESQSRVVHDQNKIAKELAVATERVDRKSVV